MHDAVGIRHFQLQIHVGVLLFEIAQQCRQHVLGNGGAGADHEYAADVAGHFAHRVFHFRVELEDTVGILENPLTGFGEADTVVGAVEQTGVEVFFQLAHLEGHCRLGHVQRLGRLGEAEQPRDRMKYLQSPICHTHKLLMPASRRRKAAPQKILDAIKFIDQAGNNTAVNAGLHVF